MTNVAAIGHNNPPDPIDEALAPYGDIISESENWLDGEAVKTEDQMKAVDALIAQMRKASKDIEDAKKSASAPLHDAWKAELARWKPTQDDIERIKKGLVGLVDPFKRELAEKQKEAERQARLEADAKRRAAEEKARAANASDIEAQREAAQAQAEAEAAQKAMASTSKNKVKGLRTVTKYEVTDHKALLHWIASNRRDDLTAFIDAWAQKNHKAERDAAGLRVWDSKEAY